jgi:hypothetical protein
MTAGKACGILAETRRNVCNAKEYESIKGKRSTIKTKHFLAVADKIRGLLKT